MEVPEELESRLQGLSEEIQQQLARRKELSQRRQALQSNHDQKWKGLNFREKYLRGFLGGNQNKSREARELKQEISQLGGLEEQCSLEVKTIDEQANQSVHSYLKRNDESYETLSKDRQVLRDTVNRSNNFVRDVRSAQRNIEDAKFWVEASLRHRGNSGFGTWSSQEAHSDVNSVQSAIGPLRASVDRYNRYARDRNLPTVSEADQIYIGDNFLDSLSWLFAGNRIFQAIHLSSLVTAGNDLSRVRQQAEYISETLNFEYKRINREMQEMIDEIKKRYI